MDENHEERQDHLLLIVSEEAVSGPRGTAAVLALAHTSAPARKDALPGAIGSMRGTGCIGLVLRLRIRGLQVCCPAVVTDLTQRRHKRRGQVW